jgi:hypothetical protein
MATHFMDTLNTSKALLADWLRRLLAARQSRIEHEKQFYRDLRAYCRTNNLSLICEDDWKSAAYGRDDDVSEISCKGQVS